MYMIWILAALVFVVAAVLFIPIRVQAHYDSKFELDIKVLFFKIGLTNKNKSGKKSGTKPKQSKSSSKPDIYGISKKLISLIDDIKSLAEFFSARCLVIENLALRLDFGTDDVAKTGIATGWINGIVYTTVAVIDHNTTVKTWTVDIQPDFQKEKFDVDFRCIARTRLLHIISIGIKGLRLYNKFKKI